MKTILVCGGRNYADSDFFHYAMKEIIKHFEKELGEHAFLNKEIHIIAGGASGADTMAEDFARLCDIPFTEYPADWKTYGKVAGLIRNEQMLVEGKPDVVVAFPGGTGTNHMVKISKIKSVPVIDLREQEFSKL